MSNDPFEVELQESSYELHEEDEWYEGRLDDIEYEKEGMYGPQFKWVYDLDDDDEDARVWEWTSTKFTPQSKMYKRVKGITGESPDMGEAFNIKTLIGNRVKVMFEHKPSQDKDGNPITRDRIAVVKGVFK